MIVSRLPACGCFAAGEPGLRPAASVRASAGAEQEEAEQSRHAASGRCLHRAPAVATRTHRHVAAASLRRTVAAAAALPPAPPAAGRR